MPNLARVRAVWTGTTVVGPGVSTFYMDEAGEGWTADLTAFFESIKNYIATGTSIKVDSSGDLIDVASGELTGTWSEVGAASVVATGGGSFPLGVGARVKWQTNGIRNGRRVTGSTFLVPLYGAAYEGANALTAGVVNAIQSAAQTLVAAQSGTMKIYSRPGAGGGGQASVVTNSVTPDAVSWLRTRRT